MKSKASPKLVKAMNRQMIINELKNNPQQSRADIAKKTNLSRPCVSELVKEMIDEGLIIEVGVGTSTGGKRPILLEYNVKSNYVLGAMIEGRSLSMILADMQGGWIDSFCETFSLPTNGQVIINLLDQSANRLLKRQNIAKSEILGMAIGIPGIASDVDRQIGFTPGVEWQDICLEEEITSRLGIQVVVDNDVNMMTLGEYHCGYGKEVKDLVYVFVGNGVGSGIILDGRFHKGYHSAAGEIGHMIIGTQAKKYRDMGVFETNYGLLGIEQRMRQGGIPYDEKRSLVENLQTQKEINPAAKSLLNEVLYHWAAAIINISSILDPQMVILSGGMADLNRQSLEHFTRIVKEYLPKEPQIRVTSLGSEAGLHGAVHLALEQFGQASFLNKSYTHR